MPPRLKTRHSALAVVIGAFLLFQNCAQAPEEGSLLTSSSISDSVPHAFDAQLDTIAHMSCSEIKTNIEKRAYFSYRAGSYNPATGGLTLSTAYRNYTNLYNPTERGRLLSTSAANSNSRLTLSIRSVGNYQAPWVSEELRVGEEIESFLPPLDNAEIAGPLAASQNGQRVNYFPGANSKRLLEASLRFFKFENVMRDTRNALDGRTALLVAGYSSSSSELDTALRGPSGASSTSVYGTGYYLRFSLPFGYQSGERRVFSPTGGVEEVDLISNSVRSANWDCSAAYQFMIVRPEDKAAGRVVCNATVDRYNDANQQAALSAIRRVLRVEDWFVDLNNRCVIPKRTGDYCYGALNNRTIQYGQANCINAGGTLCPHFVSVCIRR